MSANDKYRHCQKQPLYFKRPAKIEARMELAVVYRHFTKQEAIPAGRGYWSLCTATKALNKFVAERAAETGKDPKWIEAGVKAHVTRAQNGK